MPVPDRPRPELPDLPLAAAERLETLGRRRAAIACRNPWKTPAPWRPTTTENRSRARTRWRRGPDRVPMGLPICRPSHSGTGARPVGWRLRLRRPRRPRCRSRPTPQSTASNLTCHAVGTAALRLGGAADGASGSRMPRPNGRSRRGGRRGRRRRARAELAPEDLRARPSRADGTPVAGNAGRAHRSVAMRIARRQPTRPSPMPPSSRQPETIAAEAAAWTRPMRERKRGPRGSRSSTEAAELEVAEREAAQVEVRPAAEMAEAEESELEVAPAAEFETKPDTEVTEVAAVEAELDEPS